MPPPSGITTSRVLPGAFHGRRLAASEYECKANRFAVTICCPPFSLVNRCRLTTFSPELFTRRSKKKGSRQGRKARQEREGGRKVRVSIASAFHAFPWRALRAWRETTHPVSGLTLLPLGEELSPLFADRRGRFDEPVLSTEKDGGLLVEQQFSERQLPKDVIAVPAGIASQCENEGREPGRRQEFGGGVSSLPGELSFGTASNCAAAIRTAIPR